MPIYDYVCGSCGHRYEVFHGLNEAGPVQCPLCEGPVTRAFVPPTIHFKGSGWAKKDRQSSSGASARKAAAKAGAAAAGGSSTGGPDGGASGGAAGSGGASRGDEAGSGASTGAVPGGTSASASAGTGD